VFAVLSGRWLVVTDSYRIYDLSYKPGSIEVSFEDGVLRLSKKGVEIEPTELDASLVVVDEAPEGSISALFWSKMKEWLSR